MFLFDVMQRRAETGFYERISKLHGESPTVSRGHILAGEENRKAVKVIAVWLRLAINLRFLEKAVFDRIVMNSEKEVGLVFVSYLRALNQTNITTSGID